MLIKKFDLCFPGFLNSQIHTVVQGNEEIDWAFKKNNISAAAFRLFK